jgi:hypothetical protein
MQWLLVAIEKRDLNIDQGMSSSAYIFMPHAYMIIY